MKQIILITLLFLTTFIIVGADTITPPAPKYIIVDVFEGIDNKEICFIVKGYQEQPCLNSSEFVSIEDAQSLQNFHNRMIAIDTYIRENQEAKIIYNKQCTINLECDTNINGHSFVCHEGKCKDSNDINNWFENIKNIIGGTI